MWLHCVSIGNEYLWLVYGENPWIQMHARYAVGGRTGWWMEDSTRWNGWSGMEWIGNGWMYEDGERSRWNRRRNRRKKKRKRRTRTRRRRRRRISRRRRRKRSR